VASVLEGGYDLDALRDGVGRMWPRWEGRHDDKTSTR
jgi:acetoin utilization deacetylase AcuC-like enzyme